MQKDSNYILGFESFNKTGTYNGPSAYDHLFTRNAYHLYFCLHLKVNNKGQWVRNVFALTKDSKG